MPAYRTAAAVWTPIGLEGLTQQMMLGNGMGFNWEGLYTTSLLDAHANWRSRANELSRTLKISMLVWGPMASIWRWSVMNRTPVPCSFCRSLMSGFIWSS